jgi:hypothetical protein
LLSNHRVWLITIILLSFLLIEVQSNPIIVTASSQVIFDQTGIGSDFNGFVLIVDGVGYNCTSMPISFQWETGSVHDFSFASFLNVSSGKRYSWKNTTGLSTLQSGVILVSEPGMIEANYATQFYLTLLTNPPLVTTPSGKGWFDAGTYATISTNALINDTIQLGQKRYAFRDWVASNVTNPTSPNTTVLMDSWKTVEANYTIQYYWTWDQKGLGSDFVGTVLSLDGKNYGVEDLPFSSWYNRGTIINFTITTSYVVSPEAKRYVFAYNDGTTTGGPKPHHDYLSSGQYMIALPGYLSPVFDTQYYLSVTSSYGNSTPTSGWYSANSSITSSVVSQWKDANGTIYECIGWNGNGSVPSLGSTTTVTFKLAEESSITWNWLKANTQIRGDVNGDGTVNILDVILMASTYGSKEGDSNWNAKADIAAPTGIVDMLDLVTCVSNYGHKNS